MPVIANSVAVGTKLRLWLAVHRFVRSLRLCSMVWMLTLTLSCTPAAASSSSHSAVFRPRFRTVATSVTRVSSNGGFILVQQQSAGMPAGILIDESSGKRSGLPRSGCDEAGTAPALTGPWLMFQCFAFRPSPLAPRLTSLRLYALASGTWRTVTPTGRVARFIAQCSQESVEEHGNCSITPLAAGRLWVQWGEDPGTGLTEFRFQNIRTGAIRTLPGWKPNGTIVPDLDASTLASHLCRPLHVPRGTWTQGYPPPTPGSLEFHGPFALSYDWYLPGSAHWLLERCGSKLHRVLTNLQASATQHAIVFTVSGTGSRIDGLFLPSLDAFRITGLPFGPFAPNQLALSNRTVYALDGYGRLWAAPAPHPPPRR
jgi:hypothetical protein